MTAVDDRIAPADVRRCSHCGAPFVMAETPSERVMPIDIKPHASGEYVLLAWGIVRRGPPYLLGRPYVDAEPDEPRFQAHFRTCRKKGPSCA